MKILDCEVHARIIGRVVERIKAEPQVNTATPQEAIVAVLEMMEHEYRQAYEIMPMEDAI